MYIDYTATRGRAYNQVFIHKFRGTVTVNVALDSFFAKRWSPTLCAWPNLYHTIQDSSSLIYR